MEFIKKNAPYLIFVQSLIAILGSLFFSEVLNFPPCVLCWYQRIAIYPIVVLAAVGIIRKDNNFVYYTLPLAIVGLGISIFHNLLYWNIIPESAAPCVAGISCTTKFIEIAGFITIPFLSFVALLVITTLSIVFIKTNKTNTK